MGEKVTNSLVNGMLSTMTGMPNPVVGMGITELHWTDREAGTITRVSKSGKQIWYTMDEWKRVDKLGMTDSGQQYEFSSVPVSESPSNYIGTLGQMVTNERTAKLRNGKWKCPGGTPVLVGLRQKYHDFSF